MRECISIHVGQVNIDFYIILLCICASCVPVVIWIERMYSSCVWFYFLWNSSLKFWMIIGCIYCNTIFDLNANRIFNSLLTFLHLLTWNMNFVQQAEYHQPPKIESSNKSSRYNTVCGLPGLACSLSEGKRGEVNCHETYLEWYKLLYSITVLLHKAQVL